MAEPAPQQSLALRLEKVRGLGPEALRSWAIATAKNRMSELESAEQSWEAFYFGYDYTMVQGSNGAMRMETFWVEEGIGNAVTAVIHKKALGGYAATGQTDVGDAVPGRRLLT